MPVLNHVPNSNPIKGYSKSTARMIGIQRCKVVEARKNFPPLLLKLAIHINNEHMGVANPSITKMNRSSGSGLTSLLYLGSIIDGSSVAGATVK